MAAAASTKKVATKRSDMAVTKEDIVCVNKTWKVIWPNQEDAGVLILKTFLDQHPDYYEKFARFKDHPRETVTENKIFRNHASKIMGALNETFKNIENPAAFSELLKNLGAGHKKRGIKEAQFLELKEVILGILAENYKLPQNEIDSWNRVLSAAIDAIAKGLA